MNGLLFYILFSITLTNTSHNNTMFCYESLMHSKIDRRSIDKYYNKLFYEGSETLKYFNSIKKNSIYQLIYNNDFKLIPEAIFFYIDEKETFIDGFSVYFFDDKKYNNIFISLYISLNDSSLKRFWKFWELIFDVNPKLLIKLLSALYSDFDFIFYYSTPPPIIEFKE